ncbi:hypothetical protein VTK56DRAFT_3129 [Thermocarpiscus australiensis]
MATAPLPNIDLSTLTSPADIFSSSSSTNNNYTLPQIRAIHAALHARVGDVAARLRTRVGGSYRELLGTADTIVAMRRDLDEGLLATLGDMGGRCGRAVVLRRCEGLRGFVKNNMADGRGMGYMNGEGEARMVPSSSSLGVEARGRLLEGCLLGLRGLFRKGGWKGEPGGSDKGERLVAAARLYVLARLLVKSFGPAEEEEGKVKGARKSLETVHWARLKGAVDAVLRSESDKSMKQGDVLKALSAYSLATSSGARDVLGHFLTVRAEAIAMALEVDEEERAVRHPKDVIRALALYAKTLQDVQALVPHKLTDALVALKEERLLENASLKEMECLRLDIYRRWCGDEIQFYTPFIRHDDLDGKQAREMLTNWTDKGSQVLLQGLEKTLEGMTEFKAIVELRTSVLKLWIAEGGKVSGFDPSVLLNQLRDAINKHMLRVLEAKVAKLRLVGSEVSATLDAWREGTTDKHQSLWDVASYDTDLSNGAAQFTQDIMARLHGRNDAVSKAVTSYNSWFHVISEVSQVVDQLKRQRWDNDVDEIEDEETIEERQKLLAKDDPLALSEHLNRLLIEAFRRLDGHLTTLWGAQREGPNNGAVASYFLRVIRGIRGQLPEIEAINRFGLAAVPSLQEALAAAVVVSPLDEFVTVALARKTVVGKSLWEGEPALPGSPSPGVFRFLRNLTTAMGDAGGDLWSPAAVTVLKRQLCKQLVDAWMEALQTLTGNLKGTAQSQVGKEDAAEDEAEKTAPIKGDASPDQHRDLLVQWLLDVFYLRLFLGSQGTSDEDMLKELEDAVYQKTGLESAAVRERLAKTSQEYFKRTGLLFGFLT